MFCFFVCLVSIQNIESISFPTIDPSLLADNLYPLPRVEVIRRLRDKLEPILLFDESEDAANLRLRALEVTYHSRLLFVC